MKKNYYSWSGQEKKWYWWSGSQTGWGEPNDSTRYDGLAVIAVVTPDGQQLSDPPSPGDPVISIKDMAQWQEHWDRAAKYKKLLVYEFYKKNCSACKVMDKPFEELASKYKGEADFCKLDVDNFELFARICGVEGAYPTFVLFKMLSKKCEQVGNVVGAKDDDLERSIARAISSAAGLSTDGAPGGGGPN